jgi:hypothetical protein
MFLFAPAAPNPRRRRLAPMRQTEDALLTGRDRGHTLSHAVPGDGFGWRFIPTMCSPPASGSLTQSRA